MEVAGTNKGMIRDRIIGVEMVGIETVESRAIDVGGSGGVGIAVEVTWVVRIIIIWGGTSAVVWILIT